MKFYIKATGSVCYGRSGITYPVPEVDSDMTPRDYVEWQGGENVTWERQYGWENQPEVLCFEGSQLDARNVEAFLPRGLLVSAHWTEG